MWDAHVNMLAVGRRFRLSQKSTVDRVINECNIHIRNAYVRTGRGAPFTVPIKLISRFRPILDIPRARKSVQIRVGP